MFKRLILSVLLLGSGSAQGGLEAADILARADSYRLAADSAKVVSRAELYEDGQLTQRRLYHVYVKPGRRSLVLMKSAAEQGQKVLMLDERFWLFLPSSRRPIRITPAQKLLGEASTGDIASMTWREDYTGRLLGEDSVEGVPALKLELAAARPGTSYERVLLWVRADGHQPLQAELYLQSGKLAKRARYEMGELEGRAAVVRTHLQDRIQRNRHTVIEILEVQAMEIPDKVYNPAFLLRENVEGL